MRASEMALLSRVYSRRWSLSVLRCSERFWSLVADEVRADSESRRREREATAVSRWLGLVWGVKGGRRGGYFGEDFLEFAVG